jgi:fructose-1-phosphate kinase PfkB-like protein
VTLRCLQYSDFRLLQFVGTGPEGDAVTQMLDGMFDPAVLSLTVRPKSGLRTCTSIVAKTETTELVEPSGVISPEELQALLDAAATVTADAICVMGSLPPGCPDDTYAKLFKRMSDPSTLTLIDSVVGLAPLLDEIAATTKSPGILKCNASELCRLGGVAKSSSETGKVQQEELVRAVQGFLKQYASARRALSALAITDGEHPAYMAALPVSLEETEWRLFQLPIARLKEGERSSRKKRTSIASSWGQHSWIDLQTAIVSTATGGEAAATAAAEADDSDVTVAENLYPVGAGDAVAAGTLAAWKALTDARRQSSRDAHTHPPSRTHLPPQQQQHRMHPLIHDALSGNETPAARAMLAAFSFGLACGTASCLQHDNSKVDLDDVLQFYSKEGRPIFLSSFSMQ